MDFTLTDDQQLLAEQVSRFLEREYDFARRRRILEASGFDAAVWGQFAELGLLGAHVPAEAGGYGGGVETLVILQAMGRHLVLEPMVECAVIAASAIASGAAGPVREQRMEALIAGTSRPVLAVMEPGMRTPYVRCGLETRAERDGAGWRLSGVKAFIDGGGAADAFLVLARTGGEDEFGLFFVPAKAEGLKTRAYRGFDGRTVAELAFSDLKLDGEALIGGAGEGGAIVDRALDRGLAAYCAEAVGSMDRLLEATIAYTRQREQYGAPLASFQALQHRMADMFVELETARSMAYLAASAVDADGPERSAQVAAARVQVGRAARFVAQNAVQLHGGMGMSEDLDVAHHFKRLTLISQVFGEDSLHLRRFRAASIH